MPLGVKMRRRSAEGVVLNVIKDHVVTLVTFGEILFGVVNDVICAD